MRKDWWKKSADGVPSLKTAAPGPESIRMHAHTTKYFHGLSGQVKFFPVCFSEVHGNILTDVDGNRYLDFSSGIYVISPGHCHPRVSEAVAHCRRREGEGFSFRDGTGKR